MKMHRKEDSGEVRQPQQRAECHIELTGPGAVDIEGCMGVLAYDDASVRLALKKRTLLVTGCGLYIDMMAGQTVRICGCIECVRFV